MVATVPGRGGGEGEGEGEGEWRAGKGLGRGDHVDGRPTWSPQSGRWRSVKRRSARGRRASVTHQATGSAGRWALTTPKRREGKMATDAAGGATRRVRRAAGGGRRAAGGAQRHGGHAGAHEGRALLPQRAHPTRQNKKKGRRRCLPTAAAGARARAVTDRRRGRGEEAPRRSRRGGARLAGAATPGGYGCWGALAASAAARLARACADTRGRRAAQRWV